LVVRARANVAFEFSNFLKIDFFLSTKEQSRRHAMAKCTGLELGAMEASKPNWAITASGVYDRWGTLVFSPPKNPTKPETGVFNAKK